MLLGTLGTSLLENMLVRKGIVRAGSGNPKYYWKSKLLSDEKDNSIKMSNHSITSNLSYYGTKTRVEFNGSCLKQGKITFKIEK